MEMMERLEGRMLLAGNVTAVVAGGSITITGDRRGNDLLIDTKGLGAGQLRLTGENTSINGEFGPVEFSGVTQDIRVFLGDGKNRLQVSHIDWPHGLEAFSGDGADVVQVDVSDLGSLLVRSGGGNDSINLVDSSVRGDTNLGSGEGNDLVTLVGCDFARKVVVQTGRGNDTVFHHAIFERGKRIEDGAGKDLVSTRSIERVFDFRHGQQGWRGGFADVFAHPEVSQELEWGIRPLPSEIRAGTGMFITSHNSTDDTFMYLTKALGRSDGLEKSATYQVRFDIRVASNAPSNCGGIGGQPGESVYLKAGATPIRPRATADEEGIKRLNVDHGQQATGGKAASLIGNIANGQDCPNNPTYVSLRRMHIHPTLVKTDGEGRMHLIVGTDSGFEGTTALYYQRIGMKLIRVAD
ncbi:MAG TPA: hypothetical protein VGQ99_19270 [Tepidisphaeraceae bacterium]|jgi:hypothetical protein|nr:hypothetical protein [Tepidisphaeraceae bacterium]